jgi:hypothetical protein
VYTAAPRAGALKLSAWTSIHDGIGKTGVVA